MIDNLNPDLLKMTEMLATLAPKRTAMRDEIETKLTKAFETLIKESYTEDGLFFLSQSGINADQLTYQAVKAIRAFNRV